jgi:DNA-binding GntR family transcriptional regulator
VAGPLKRITLKEQAYQALREMIRSYRFTPGGWINVEQIAKELGVSRTPVWQALKQLESEGLVRHEPNRGIRMVEMTREMAVDLYLVRGELEGLAARLAAPSMNGELLREMEQVLREQEEIVARRDVLAYSRSDFRFHALLYEACGNWLLKELLGNIKARARPLGCDITPILPDLYRDHRAVVRALGQRDAEAAERAIKRHNERMRRLVAGNQGCIDSGGTQAEQ